MKKLILSLMDDYFALLLNKYDFVRIYLMRNLMY